MKRKTVIAIYMRLSQDDSDLDAESNSIVNQRRIYGCQFFKARRFKTVRESKEWRSRLYYRKRFIQIFQRLY